MNDKVKEQAAAAGIGLALGAATKHVATRGPTAAQIGSAVGATLATGGGIGAAASAGVGVVGVKVAAVTALAEGAAPLLAGAALVGGAVWGISKLFKD